MCLESLFQTSSHSLWMLSGFFFYETCCMLEKQNQRRRSITWFPMVERGWEVPVLSIHKLEACVGSQPSPGSKDVRTRSQQCKPQFRSHRAWLLAKAFMPQTGSQFWKEEAISWLTEGRFSLPLFFHFQGFRGWVILHLYQPSSLSLVIPLPTPFRSTAAGTLASDNVPAVTLSKEHRKWTTKGPPIVSWAPHTFLAYA